MAKTLRVRTRTGWVTKPVADEPANRLIAEEVDDNFIALEQAIEGKKSFEIGYTALVAYALNMPGWLPMDGWQYQNTEYPTLAAMIGGVPDFSTVVTANPGVASTGYDIAYNHDGSYLAVAHAGGDNYTVFDTSTWTALTGLPAVALTGRGVDFSPDGKYLAVITNSGPPSLYVMTTADWTLVTGTPSLTGPGQKCRFSPDGKYLAVGMDASPWYYVIDTSDWSTVAGLPAVSDYCPTFAWSKDSTMLAVGTNASPYLIILDSSDWSQIPSTPTLSGAARGLAFSPDGAYLATTGSLSSPTLKVWNTSDWSGVTLNAPGIGSAISYAADFSPDSKYLAIGYLNTPYWFVLETTGWTEDATLPNLTGTGRGVVFSPDGRFLAASHATSPFATVVNTQDQTVFTTPIMESPRPDMQWRIKAEDV